MDKPKACYHEEEMFINLHKCERAQSKSAERAPQTITDMNNSSLIQNNLLADLQTPEKYWMLVVSSQWILEEFCYAALANCHMSFYR